MKTKALYAGSFDPFTFGHLEVVKQALQKYDELVIYVTNNPCKDYMFILENRVQMVEDAVLELPDCERIKVVSGSVSAVDIAIAYDVISLIRGIRPSTTDLQEETNFSLINEHLASIRNKELKTDYIYVTDIFLQTVSSTVAKKLLTMHEFILLAAMVPQNVYNQMMKKEFDACIDKLFLHYDDQCIVKRMLQNAYSERGYHSLQHLGDMLNMLAYYVQQTEGSFNPKNYYDVILAILWHDMVIEGDEKETAEEKSVKSLLHITGEWAENINEDINREEVIGMIRATQLGVPATTEKQKLIADLDKVVLGASFVPWWRRYEGGLRMEYPEATDKEYLEGRIKFLRKLKSLDRIYQTDFFYKQLEATAKTNISISICLLKSELQALS